MRRVLALFLAFALLFQSSWAAAATYCEHEPSTQAAKHFGHHVHIHKSADGKKLSGGTLAQDDDCASCHGGHPAIVQRVAAIVAAAPPSPTTFSEPSFSASAPPRAPDRPQWPRLASPARRSSPICRLVESSVPSKRFDENISIAARAGGAAFQPPGRIGAADGR